jgi:hypothetical protein
MALVRTDVSEGRLTLQHQDEKNERTRKGVSSNYQLKHVACSY